MPLDQTKFKQKVLFIQCIRGKTVASFGPNAVPFQQVENTGNTNSIRHVDPWANQSLFMLYQKIQEY